MVELFEQLPQGVGMGRVLMPLRGVETGIQPVGRGRGGVFVAMRQVLQQQIARLGVDVVFHRAAPSVVGDVGNVATEGSSPSCAHRRAG